MRLSPSAHADTFCRDNLPPDGLWPDFLFTLPELQYPERLNAAAELLDATAGKLGGGRPCLLGEDRITWSYDDVVRISNQVAWVLADELGVAPGNRVLLRGPNNPWLAVCWLGVLKAGAVAVTTTSPQRSGELATICEVSRPTVALCDHRFTEDLAAARVAGLQIISYGGAGPEDLTARIEPMPRNFSAVVLKPRADDIFTGTPPLAFTYGLGGLLVFPLRAGAATLLLEKATPAELADHIAARGVTVLSTAPTAFRAMLAAGKADQLRGLRRPVSAGEHLSASVWQSFYDATAVKIIDGIGSTEMLHIFISSADDEIRPGSTGRAVPGYEAAILDAEGKPVPDGTPGRLAVKGPTGCTYLADDRQRTYVQDGWNFTGDTYVRDAEGYFWYQARSDDMIISGGYNIAGPEIEEALLGHPDVAECGVVGVPDEARGQIVKAFVVLRDGASGGEAKVAELQEFVKQRIAPYKYPRAVEFLAALPRTNTGKLQRYRLRDLSAS